MKKKAFAFFFVIRHSEYIPKKINEAKTS